MYLSVDSNGFGFKDPEINEILATDKEITEEIYNQFFQLQSQGKQFKVININGTTFNEIFEEVIPYPIVVPKSQLQILQETVDALVIASLGV